MRIYAWENQEKRKTASHTVLFLVSRIRISVFCHEFPIVSDSFHEKSKLVSKAWDLEATGISNGQQFLNASGSHKHKLSIDLGVSEISHKLNSKVVA